MYWFWDCKKFNCILRRKEYSDKLYRARDFQIINPTGYTGWKSLVTRYTEMDVDVAVEDH